MLKPTKHLNPKYSVLNIGAHALKLLAYHHTIIYDELYERLERRFGNELRPVFLPAISFLYLLGKVEYHTKNDSFEYRAT
jgi:hypothetical protein